jgi:hypothetical protein
MSQQPINGEPVEVVVVAADGTSSDAPLTPREVWTLGAVDTVLQTNGEFMAAYPGAKLVRVDAMRGVEEHRNGRYYLRYRWQQGMAEFWGHVSRKTATFDFKKGVVGVVVTPDTPKT